MTVINESFDKADAATLGPDLTWTEVVGADWGVTSNQGAIQAAGTDNHARAEHDLATVHQYAEVTIPTISEGTGIAVGGVMVHYSTSADTAYCFQARRQTGAGADDYSLARWNAGVETFPLGSLISQAPVAGDRIRLEVRTLDANTVRLNAFVNGVLVATHDDTTASRITTGTRCGLRGIVTGSGALSVDTFQAGDLVTPTPSFLTLGVGL